MFVFTILLFHGGVIVIGSIIEVCIIDLICLGLTVYMYKLLGRQNESGSSILTDFIG